MPPLMRCFHLDQDVLSASGFVEMLFDHFGFEHGRLIVGSPDELQKRLSADNKLLLNDHQKAFESRQGFLFLNHRPGPVERLNAADYIGRHQGSKEKWGVTHTLCFSRTSTALADLLGALLIGERKIWLVDPEFRLDGKSSKHGTCERFTKVANEIFKTWMTCNPDSVCTVGIVTSRPVSEELDKWVKSTPAGIRVKMIFVPEPADADGQRRRDLHNRFVLTEKGGVMLGWGLDSGYPNQKDLVARLSVDAYCSVMADLKRSIELVGLQF